MDRSTISTMLLLAAAVALTGALSGCHGCDRPRWAAPSQPDAGLLSDPASPGQLDDMEALDCTEADCETVNCTSVTCYCASAGDCPEDYQCLEAGFCATNRPPPTPEGSDCIGTPKLLTDESDPDIPDFCFEGLCDGKVWEICDAATGRYRPPSSVADIDNPAGSEISGLELIETTCDGFDNDCDGKLDTEDTVSSWTQGVCAQVPEVQRQVCQGTRFRDMSPTEVSAAFDGNAATRGLFEWVVQPVPGAASEMPVTLAPSEVSCDGFDNDCDGSVDETFVIEPDNAPQYPGDPCLFHSSPTPPILASAGTGSICQQGFLRCRDGAIVCEGQVAPETEVCLNLLDDDCDGRVDEQCVGGPCRDHDDCPDMIMQDGEEFDVYCEDDLEGGLCVMECDCSPCRTCIFDFPDTFEQECADICVRCEAASAYCESNGGLCGRIRDPDDPDARLECCVRDCDAVVPEERTCREGFACTDIRLLDEERRACYPE